MRLNGKTALITGGNSGIGLATARAFIDQGAKVAITGRDQATLDAAAASLGPNVLAFRADITDAAANEAAIRSAGETFGQLDIVVANAGVSGNTPVGGTTAEQFERIMTTNVTGVFLTVQAAAPYLRQGASVILLGSVHAVLGAPGYPPTPPARGPSVPWAGCWHRSYRPPAFASTWSFRVRRARRSGLGMVAVPARWPRLNSEWRKRSRRGGSARWRKSPTPSCFSRPTTQPTFKGQRSLSMAA